MDICRVLPQPVPVKVGGSVRLVRPLRLSDVALLQNWIASAIPSPLDAVRDEALTLSLNRRRRLLSTVYEACEAWPPRYGSEEADALFQTAQGVAFFLSVVAQCSEWSSGDLSSVFDAITPKEYEAITRAAFGSDPIEECGRLMRLRDREEAGEDLNWPKAFGEVAELTGWTFAEIGALTLSQWVAIRTGGEIDTSVAIPPGMTADEHRGRQAARFNGTEADEDEGASDA